MPNNITEGSNYTQRGNAMIYVLIALALLGVLTASLSSQNSQSDGQEINDELAELYANELLEYIGSAQQIVDMMISTGSKIDDLDFVNPSSTAFDTPPHMHKIFHPAGGGLNYQETFNEKIAGNVSFGWFIKRNTNVEWTPTANFDVMLSALRINKSVCEQLNKQITGSITIPQVGAGLNAYFEEDGTDSDLTAAACPGCVGYPALCVINVTNTAYAFYSIIAAQ